MKSENDADDDEEMTPESRLVKTIGKTKKTKKPKAPEPGLFKTIGKTKKNKKNKRF